MNELTRHDMKQFKKLEKDLTRCRQVCINKINYIDRHTYSRPKDKEKAQSHRGLYVELLNLIDQLLGRIG